MCLILFAWNAHPEYRLVLGANRDEFYDRPTAPAAPWPEAPDVIAGRDLRAGGTWLGVTRSGRWAAVTNVRTAEDIGRQGRSRGLLVAEYLLGDDRPLDYAAAVAAEGELYGGFNLLVGDADSVAWISNRAARAPERVPPGVHGLSNARLNTPWPKVERGKRELDALIRDPRPDPSALLDRLMDRTLAADHELPDTGVGTALERALSASFIVTDGYGTRASTALLVRRDGRVDLVERSFSPEAPRFSEVHHTHAAADQDTG